MSKFWAMPDNMTFVKRGGSGVIGGTGRTGGYGLSPEIWFDCPIPAMQGQPGVGVFDWDDFTSITATGFPYLIAGSGGTLGAKASFQYGAGVLTTGGSANDEAYVTTCNNLAGLIYCGHDKEWWFEARVLCGQIATSQGLFVGLAKATGVGADFMTDTTMALKVQDYLGFQVIDPSDGGSIWQAVHCIDSGARVAVNATAATATTDWMKLGMKSVPNSTATISTITFYVDGEAVDTCTTADTNYPLEKYMQVTFANKVLAGAANYLSVDWWAAGQLR